MKKETTINILKKMGRDVSSIRTGIDLLVASDTLITSINETKPTKSVPSDETIQVIPGKTLIWGKCANKEMNWEDANKWCKEQGGRLPTQIELLQAYEDKVGGFNMEGVYRSYWSATTGSGYATHAWLVNLSNGYTLNDNKTNTSNVRCVRE